MRTIPPEARAYQGRRAGVVSRLSAGIVDYAVALLVLLAIWLGWAAVTFAISPSRFSWPAWPGGAIILGFPGALVAVLTLGWASIGQTPGGYLFGLRVLTKDATRLRVGHAFLRALLVAIFPFGLLWAAVDRRDRSVQDLLVRTQVVYDWTRRVPPHRA